ncbi:DUF3168 domain-containing protein [Maritimibacter sp. UBA3975]|uniref:DUF3168 domain-containing protein n=1 Tax=Maritimibacter sp. UBA3975 TaxID=1946833 RepID=UPI000C0998B3|nr:DUF3168 domain-containing protein [Maritimibacter sp. UBA3975]MAM61058.1 hypothetical protein [Maritimibacter sp.]|tara:strand:- start:4781 stop:5191 length:411 start_codon:yes stop_codon:yes gene_type:complete
MSYGTALALQEAIYQRLTADSTLAGLVGGAIYDAVPPGLTNVTYVALGPEDVRDAADMSGQGALHEVTVSIVSDSAGFATAKEVAGAVSDALLDAPLTLTRGVLVALNFYRARARRVQDADMRRIDLRFRARVEDS